MSPIRARCLHSPPQRPQWSSWLGLTTDYAEGFQTHISSPGLSGQPWTDLMTCHVSGSKLELLTPSQTYLSAGTTVCPVAHMSHNHSLKCGAQQGPVSKCVRYHRLSYRWYRLPPVFPPSFSSVSRVAEEEEKDLFTLLICLNN